ncbi:Mitochondrial import inner membrane translocase subunit tim8 [Tulasnella sp. 419]|nr:Mitochondrial import inner membrane translocase subunit tim8 [Tulasnella sp. 418]KAG8968791.1 Mitochondrial import inner membrane translocase subunit tim8 [Tulasnella sp. 419]
MDGFDKFDDATKKELEAFLTQQQALAGFQQSVQKHTEMCWTKCVTGSISTRFSRGEESCLQNCVDRFLDSSLFIVKKLDEARGGQSQS